MSLDFFFLFVPDSLFYTASDDATSPLHLGVQNGHTTVKIIQEEFILSISDHFTRFGPFVKN